MAFSSAFSFTPLVGLNNIIRALESAGPPPNYAPGVVDGGFEVIPVSNDGMFLGSPDPVEDEASGRIGQVKTAIQINFDEDLSLDGTLPPPGAPVEYQFQILVAIPDMTGLTPDRFTLAQLLDAANTPYTDISEYLPLLSVVPTSRFYGNSSYALYPGYNGGNIGEDGVFTADTLVCWDPRVSLTFGVTAIITPAAIRESASGFIDPAQEPFVRQHGIMQLSLCLRTTDLDDTSSIVIPQGAALQAVVDFSHTAQN